MGNPTFHASIVRTIAESNYKPTDDEIVTLVQTNVKAGTVDEGIGDTYFNVLVAASVTEYLKLDGSTIETQLAAVDTANKRLMVLVNKGAITPEIEASEHDSPEVKAEKYATRQKRTNFARSSASVLRRTIKAGIPLGSLGADAGKSAHEKAAREHEAAKAEAEGENTPEAKVAKRLAALITAIGQLPEGSKAAIVAHVVATIQAV